jgi:hypothetical protein
MNYFVQQNGRITGIGELGCGFLFHGIAQDSIFELVRCPEDKMQGI